VDERPHDEQRPDEPAEQAASWSHEPDTALEPTGAFPAPVTVPWWRQPGPAIVAGAVIIAAGVGAGIALTSGNGTAPTAADASSSPTGAPSISVHGEITLGLFDATDDTTGTALSLHDGDPCTAVAGYSDITQGAEVTVGGSTGQTLGVVGLGAGVLSPDTSGTLLCSFTFNVLVPGGQSVYTVTISRRGTQTFTPDQVAAGISLTLGS
jgi:hypothetical protein